MEYDDGASNPCKARFTPHRPTAKRTSTTSARSALRNCPVQLARCEEGIEDFILTDTNLVSIKGTPEFERNKSPDTPTNRLLTSLFCRGTTGFHPAIRLRLSR